MSSRETRVQRGKRRGDWLLRRLVGELRDARVNAGLSQAALSAALGWTQSELSRAERLARPHLLSVLDLAQWASVLGHELGAGLYPLGDPIRDKGHQALITRFLEVLGEARRVAREVPFPTFGDARMWDLVVRLGRELVGVEAETRIRDVQALAGRIHRREDSGGVQAIVLVLADTAVNRRLLPQLLDALGDRYKTPPRQLVRALRRGQPVPGSGVVLV